MSRGRPRSSIVGMRPLLLITSLAVFLGVAAPAAQATFPGPDGRIAYAQYTGVADIADLYTARPDGSDPRYVAADAWDSSWSADGRLIFNQNTGAPGGESYDLFVQDPGGTIHQITDEPYWHGTPAYSPDGSQIVFESDLGQYPAAEGLYLSDADGSNRRRLTRMPESMIFDQDPTWSPDGTRIAFLRVRSGDGFRGRAGKWWGHHYQAAIYTVAPDGSDLRRITAWGRDVGAPDWSPSGRRIVATGYWDTRSGQSSAVYTMRPDGKDIRHLFDDGSNTSNGSDHPEVHGSFDPRYSPSGRRVLFLRFLGFDGGLEMDTIGADGGGLESVFAAPTDVVLPSWGPLLG
jgi:Tol biopolymer transport system component